MLRQLLSGNMGVWDVVIYILSALAVIFLTMPVHEAAHALAADKLGDPTPRYQGRYTLNPFAHIDWLGALSIILFGFGWAKPVQVNPRNFDNPKRDMAITALAGPVANLVVAFASLLLCNLGVFLTRFIAAGFVYYVAVFFSYVASINISLAVFNLIPIPPLDGSRLLSAFLPDSVYYKIMRYERILMLVVLLLCYTGILGTPLGYLSNKIYNAFDFVTGLPFRVFGVS